MLSNSLSSLWKYRAFIVGSVKREFQSKYRNSLLGIAWPIIQPLAMILVYTVIFSQIMRAKLPGIDSTFAYSIYLCIGIITWSLFSEITTKAQSVFIDNGNLLKKLSFPRICLPVIVILNALLNFGIIFLLFTLFLIITGTFPGMIFFACIPLLILQIAFAIGLGITLGVLNVFFRDIGQFYNIFLQFWFWLTPIVYSANILPESIRPFMALNPLFALTESYQNIFTKGIEPNWSSLWPLVLVTIIFNYLGFALFRKHSGEIVDEL
ncbi:ABC transporter permease [Polynucleobacter sp. 15G-AUS-farblos]|uniref:ABC transporter permease n=1 Tax=Polynucleobacter sp. 15G-AUS-farblos TaxID=2689094 RepID=UPI001C0CE1F6|nr:ABC transporter permease [Polynucleobacter sp. 15G-AUS-farblos]MBU3584131.1 ABC transporter permease [Polynucleobacter sp. 15G-AUS-farblos]